jgi:phosphatidylglycerophosphate synthase
VLSTRVRQPLRGVMALTGFAGPLLLIFGSGAWRWIGLVALIIACVLAFLDGYKGWHQD